MGHHILRYSLAAGKMVVQFSALKAKHIIAANASWIYVPKLFLLCLPYACESIKFKTSEIMIKKHLASYRFAFRGIWLAMQLEKNMIIHLVAALTVIVVNYMLEVSRLEWVISMILIGVVCAAEIFNTAIEKLADHVTPERDPMIGQVKDLSAGAVLIVCIAAAACGMIIYWPYLF